MARMTLSGVQIDLRQAAGTATFLRAHALVSGGAVADVGRGTDGLLVGRVHDPAAEPALVHQAGMSDWPARLSGSCTCGEPEPCRHLVAVVLVGGELMAGSAVTAPTQAATLSPVAPTPGWQTSVRALVARSAAATGPPAPEPAVAGTGLGLQFEVITDPDPVAADLGQGLRLLLRPVLMNHKGSWVRTGVTWSTLPYVSQVRTAAGRRQQRLLNEFLALAGGDPRYAYVYGNQGIDLLQVASPRVWDVLTDARDAGVAFVQSGRQAAPIVLHDPVDACLVARRDPAGLQLEPRILTRDGTSIPRDRTFPLGAEPSALAWWHDNPAGRGAGGGPGAGPGALHLAPVPRSVAPQLAALMPIRSLQVPADDEQTFFADYYPELARTVEIRPVGDIGLPQAEPPVLVLTVRPLQVDRVGVEWHWQYRLGTACRTEPLWPPDGLHRAAGGRPDERDPEAEFQLLDTVLSMLSDLPQLVDSADQPEPEPAPRRLRPVTEVTGMAAVHLITGLLPALAQVDRVLVELTAEPATYRAAAAAPVLALGPATDKTERDWFDLTVSVSVDGEQVVFQQLFTALAEGHSHFLLPSGTFFPLDDPRFAELGQLIEESRALADAPESGLRVNRYQTDLLADLERLGVLSGQARQWQQTVRAIADAPALGRHPAPDGLKADLRPYQLAGFNWLATLYENGLGGVLADDMGLGKTVQTLALIAHAKQQVLARGSDPQPFLVVAPTSVIATWRAEAERFAPDLVVATVTETAARRGGQSIADLAGTADLVVTSYALFRIERDQYDDAAWGGLILDEAQAVKNHASRGYHSARTLRAPIKLAITGTPMENNLMELWSLLSITAPGLLSNADRFTDYFRNPIERARDRDRLALLRRRIGPLLLRRTKEQVAPDLPDKQEQVIEVDLAPRHRKVYQAYLQRERRRVLGLVDNLQRNRFEILRSLTLLRQASLDVALVDGAHAGVPATKLDVMMDLVQEVVDEGHRVLVFSQFTRFLTAARDRITEAGIETCYLDGKTRRRPEVIDSFRTGSAPVFLISLKAGGTGLTLIEADYCILLDPWWNPATENQAIDRTHRIGQTRKVMVYRLVAKDTVEEKVMALKAAKAELFTSVLDGGDFESATLTADDIRRLVE